MTTRAQDQGRIRAHKRFPSRYLSTSRDLIVYVPPGYEPEGRRYPVMYLQDGQNLFDPLTAFGGQDWQADITADRLIAEGAIEPLILVGIHNTGVRRISEYTPTRDPRIRKGGKADRYAEMLAREIKPFIDREYRTLKSAAHSGVGGSSLGGLVSLAAALHYPRVFGRAAVLSPSVWWDDRAILKLVNTYASRARPKLWIDAGTAEGNAPHQVVADVHMLRDALVAKGWQEGVDLCCCVDEGAGHNENAWGYRFGHVLQYLFPRQDAG